LDRFVDYYAVLDVPRNATQKEIGKAYKRLTKVIDPEINEDMFRLVNEAYQVLSDPAKRAEYDARYDAIAQAQEELTEPEEALALLCKAIMERLFGLLDLYELAELADDCAATLNEARGSPIRPEVRRLALEVAEVAEKDGLMALALLVRL
jgi:curved DNA-binding protein CbpA